MVKGVKEKENRSMLELGVRLLYMSEKSSLQM
jgi:hypothetical protein